MRRLILAFLLLALPATAQVQDDTGAGGVYTPDRSTTCTLGSLNAACTLVLEGRQGVGGYLAVGTLSGTVTPEVTVDGTNWVATSFLTWAAGASPTRVATITTTTLFQVEMPAGTKQARVRVSAYSSGSGTGTLIATEAPGIQKVAAAGADTQVQFNDVGNFGADADFIWDKTTNKLTVGAGANSFYAKPTATAFSDNFLRTAGALTRDGTAGASGVGFNFTTEPSALTEYSYGAYIYMDATNNTAAGSYNTGIQITATSGPNATGFGFGAKISARGTHPGTNVGVDALAFEGDLNIGFIGDAVVAKNGATNIGVVGRGLNTGTTPTQIGGAFILSGSVLNPAQSAALLADNGTTVSPSFVARDNGTPVFTIADGGTTTMAAPLRQADGGASAPSYSFTNATNMGMSLTTASILGFYVGGNRIMDLRADGLYLPADALCIKMDSSGSTHLCRDANHTLAQRNGTNAQTQRWYGTFTDTSNYTRAAVNTTSTTVTFAAETAGTGADNIDVTLSPVGTGSVTIPSQKSICLQDSAGGDEYCIQAEATAPAGTTQLALNIDVATCTGDGNGGALTVDGSNNIVCSADAGGAGSGLPHPEVMTRVAYGGF